MDDAEALTTFCGERLGEDKARAAALRAIARDAIKMLKDPRFLGREIPGWHSWPDVEAMCSQALRDIDAKRAILRRHEEDRHKPGQCSNCFTATGDHLRWPCPPAALVAASWKDHPDYPGRH